MTAIKGAIIPTREASPEDCTKVETNSSKSVIVRTREFDVSYDTRQSSSRNVCMLSSKQPKGDHKGEHGFELIRIGMSGSGPIR